MWLVLGRAFAALVVFLLLAPPASGAGDVTDPVNQWLPRSDGAEWTYQWSDSDYQPTPKTERYVIQSRAGTAFRLRWDETGAGVYDVPSSGTMDFRHTDAGLVNLNYQSTQPPPQFPILCASASDCGNSIAGSLFLAIWGTRSPTLAEPLLQGTRWNSLGGASNDVASASRYVGRERIAVPAFPGGVTAAKVESEITQAGAIGDPYGSGVRTVWWVRGVGPVRIQFRHTGGGVSEANLISTTLRPLAAPSDRNLLPLNRGDVMRFRWRNNKHMRKWSHQRFQVAEVVNNTARVDARHVSGPINLAASYTFATRLSGVTHLSAALRAATRAKFPRLGPRGVPSDRRRRFFTPFDLMVYGFGPIVPVYPTRGETWRSSRDTTDWRVFGVTGRSRLRGTKRVRVPAGRFRTRLIETTMRQRGYRFGSGVRKAWYAPGKGLIKLVFRHRDGSVSTVQRTA
jgi:hypothetical protein